MAISARNIQIESQPTDKITSITMAATRRVILDVDAGTDDFLALLLLFHAEKMGHVKIEAVVCTMGNTTVDNVATNVVRLLETIGRTDVPVYKGAAKQLIQPPNKIKVFHGADGFGGLQHAKTPNLGIVRPEPAAVAVADLILKNPGEISLICVAPLTNLALALRLKDGMADAIKDLWIMGGNNTAVGNITETAEYNFYIDPEAAYIVLDTVKKPIYMLTWETCLYPQISFEWRYNVFGAKKNPEIQLLNRAEQAIYSKEDKVWISCDAFLAASFINPSIITKKSCHNAIVELHGSLTRGQIVLDHLKRKQENITIIEQIDQDKIEELLLEL